jgi:hypothetical protein
VTQTCAERIENISGIDVYRSIVGMVLPLSDWYIPDPTEYAAKVDGDRDGLTKVARLLGPDKEEHDIREMYGNIASEVVAALSQTELDVHWKGKASEQFTDVYLTEIGKHLEDLKAVCKSQGEAATGIADTIKEAQDMVYGTTELMVYAIIAEAALLAVAGVAATAGSAGAGGAVAAAGSVIALLATLAERHSELKSNVTSFNTNLGKHSEGLRKLEVVDLDGIRTGVSPGELTKGGWAPGTGV